MIGVLGALALAMAAASQANATMEPPPAMVAVEGGTLSYQTCGAGPRAVVLVHDGVLDSSAWDGVWPALCARYRVVRYDRRGFGRSPEAKAPHGSLEDLAAVLHVTGIEHATFVGASAGGGVALDFALAHPEAVDRLILAGPEATGQDTSFWFKLKLTGVLMDMLRGQVNPAIEHASRLDFVLAPGHEAARRRFVEILKANPQNLTHKNLVKPRPPAVPQLGQIKAPTLILVGDHDAGDNKRNAREIADRIPGAKLVVMPDSGHMMYLEHPDAFTDQVIAMTEGGRPKP